MFHNIPLNALHLSPDNARKAAPDAADEESLMASIRTHGLLENLVVREETDGYAVIAGGRRLKALQSLADDGTIPADHPVPCHVNNGDPGEISLAENIQRLDMHPLDQFETFVALEARGLRPAEIAARFGYSERLVLQRLRLGRVAPFIREAYRAGDISLNVLMAFAITDDHATQMAVWKNMSDGFMNEHGVRNQITDGKIPVDSRYVRFIGLDAYKAAGGSITPDLFSQDESGDWLDDRALVMRLAAQKLDAIAQEIKQAEGWKWATGFLEYPYEELGRTGRVYPTSGDPTPEQEAEMTRLRQTIEAMESSGEAYNDRDTYSGLRSQYEAIAESLEQYAPEYLACAGCTVSLHGEGKPEIRRGIVRKEDMMAIRRPDTSVQAGADTEEPADPISASLKDDLRLVRLHVAQNYLAQDADCAFDLLTFSLARSMLTENGRYQSPLDMAFHRTLPREWEERDDITPIRIPAGIDLSWLEQEPAQGFAVFTGVHQSHKRLLFAWCIACTLKGTLAGRDALHDAIGARLGVDVAAHWRPTAAQYFKRVRKDVALDALAGIIDEATTQNYRGEKKGVLAEILEGIFRGEVRPGISAEQATAASRWLPDGMAYDTDNTGSAAIPEEPPADTDDTANDDDHGYAIKPDGKTVVAIFTRENPCDAHVDADMDVGQDEDLPAAFDLPAAE